MTITTATLNAGAIATSGGVTVNDSGAASITGAISGSGSALSKQGSGTLPLAGTNSYTGITSVSAGTLLVNGSTAAGSAVSVSGAGVLGGTGTVGGSVAVNSGGTITGGTLGGVGTLIVGSLSFNGGTFAADFSGNSSDTIVTSGAVNLNGGSAGIFTINSQNGSAAGGNVFTLIDNTGAGAIGQPPLIGATEGGSATINNAMGKYTYAGGTSQSFTFTAATFLAISAPTGATAGTPFTVTVTAQSSGGITATTYSGTVHFTSSDPQAVLPLNSTLTKGTGTFSVTLKTAGNQTITATDTSNNSLSVTSNTIAVRAAAATKFLVSAPGNPSAGTPFTISVTALDPFNNLATSYGGSVQLSSSDPAAVLPPGATLTGGRGTFSVTLNTAGGQTITASDSVNASITGSAACTVIASAVPPVPTAPPVKYVAIGAGAGGGPEVIVYNAATGQFVSAFYGFTPTFAGGVRVAVDDLNGDGVPDIIAAAGPGGGPQVEMINGTMLAQVQDNGEIAGSALIASFYAFSPVFTGGVFVAAGTSSSGQNWVAAGAGAGGGPQVVVWTSKAVLTGVTAGTAPTPLTSFYAFTPTFTGGVTVALGDVFGTVKLNVLAGAGPGGGPQVTIFDGSNFSLLQSFYPFAPSFRGGVFVSGGVVNGAFDLIVGAGALGSTSDVLSPPGSIGPEVAISNGAQLASGAMVGNFFALHSTFTGGVRVGFSAAYGSSGQPAILTSAGPGGSPELAIFNGSTFQDVSNFYALPPGLRGGVFIAG